MPSRTPSVQSLRPQTGRPSAPRIIVRYACTSTCEDSAARVPHLPQSESLAGIHLRNSSAELRLPRQRARSATIGWHRGRVRPGRGLNGSAPSVRGAAVGPRTPSVARSLRLDPDGSRLPNRAEPHPLLASRRPRVRENTPPVGRGGSCAPPPARRAQAVAQAATAPQRRPWSLGAALPPLGRLERRADHRQAGHGDQMASSRVPPVLELAQPAEMWPARHRSRGPQADQAAGHREPVGRPSHPRRAAQAGHPDLRGHGLEVSAASEEAALADLARVFGESCGNAGVRRLLHCADGLVSRSVRVRSAGSGPPPHSQQQRYQQPLGGVDGESDRAGIPVGERTPVPAARPGRRLRRGVWEARQASGHRASSHRSTLALAIAVRGARDRDPTSRATRPRGRGERATSAPAAT
jgi:hypothetical protein